MTEQAPPAPEQTPAQQGTHTVTLREARNLALLSAFFTIYGAVNLASGLSHNKWLYVLLGVLMLLPHVPALVIRSRQYRLIRRQGPLTIALPAVRPPTAASLRGGRVVLWTAVGVLTLLTATFDILTLWALFLPKMAWQLKFVMLTIAAGCTAASTHFLRRAGAAEKVLTADAATTVTSTAVQVTGAAPAPQTSAAHWWTDTGTRNEVQESLQQPIRLGAADR